MIIGPDNWVLGMRRQPAADLGGKLISREYGVIHYTAGTSLDGAANTLSAADETYVSAHVGIGRDGARRQFVPFNRIAYHAGVSSWEGHTGLNSRSVGVELVNPAWYRAGFPAEWPMLTGRHRNGGPVRDWYRYPPEQIAALTELIIALRDQLGIRKWVGHDHIAPGRKWDPGPALDWTQISAIPGILAPKF